MKTLKIISPVASLAGKLFAFKKNWLPITGLLRSVPSLPQIFISLLLILLLVFPPGFSQYIQINKTDGTKEKILTSVIDSITLVSGTTGTVTDIDGNVYSTVTIGTQVWMKENLKVTKYRNGDAIPTTTSTSIPNDITSKYQWAHNNDINNVAIYGRLYTWYAVTDSRNVCPTGWHVPSDTEWCTLENFVDINTDPTCNIIGLRGTNTGSKLKEAGTSHWGSPNTGADNSSGFTALPGGRRATDGAFYNFGNYGLWWSATEFSATNAWYRLLGYDYTGANRSHYYKSYGFSVRCLRD